jgi:hypothetical protein
MMLLHDGGCSPDPGQKTPSAHEQVRTLKHGVTTLLQVTSPRACVSVKRRWGLVARAAGGDVETAVERSASLAKGHRGCRREAVPTALAPRGNAGVR